LEKSLDERWGLFGGRDGTEAAWFCERGEEAVGTVKSWTLFGKLLGGL